MINQSNRPPARLAITTGEPAGIGPDLCVQLAQTSQSDILILIGDPQLLEQRATALGLSLTLSILSPEQLSSQNLTPTPPGSAWCLPIYLSAPTTPGELDTLNSPYVISTLAVAAKGCDLSWWDAIVTAPVHKGVINDAGILFSGHTEYFRDHAGVEEVVMMLATEDLRVALVTTHLPLREVANAITEDRLERVIRILNKDMQTYFCQQAPRILVAGLNPHAGESGHLGHEEIDIIEPTLNRLRTAGLNLVGPLPADTLYTPHQLKNADATLAMYHDQGLPVLKFHGFGRAANITLGLPFIRTSVDHGTALDLAGTGKADMGSLETAVRVAADMASHRTHQEVSNT